MAQWYPWIVFLHVAGVFVFLAAHGVAAFVIERVRGVKDLAALRALLEISASSSLVSNVSLLLTLVFGIWATFLGHWWSFGWPWAALGALVVISGVMSVTAGGPMRRLRAAVGFTGATKITKDADPAAVAAAQAKVNPWPSIIVGGVGLLFILWLMMLKPF